MANNQIVISRIQHRRGRRENLPQPLRPGEIALTTDTEEVWIGGDPVLAVPGIIVYSDKNTSTAQDIIDNYLTELKFNQDFSGTAFNSLTTYLTNSGVVTLVPEDIRWDETYRGEILNITITNPGTGYSPGDNITIVSPTGSAALVEVNTVDGFGGITSLLITSGGNNYRYSTTTITATQGGTNAVLSVGIDSIHGYSVFVATNPDVDPNNTIANVVSQTNASPVSQYFISGGALGGTVSVNKFLPADNQDAAADIATLINRVNTTTPNETTGLVHTNLNIKIGAGVGGTDSAAIAPYEIAFHVTNKSLQQDPGNVLATFVFTQNIGISQPGTNSRAYADVAPSTTQQVFALHKNDVQVGTVTFPIGTNVGTVSIPLDVNFVAGDRLDLMAPAVADPDIEDVSFTIVGNITITVSVSGAISSSVSATNSITGDGRSILPLKLVNDSASPGNRKYYGTNFTGVKGFYDVPLSAIPSVLDYGAVGDGVTDDTLAIQDCIDNEPVVYFPARDYRITNTLNLATGTRIVGDTRFTSRILKDNFNGPAIQGIDTNYITIERIGIVGPGRAVGGANSNKGIVVTIGVQEIVESVSFRDIQVEELNDIGVYAGSCAFVSWDNVRVRDIGFACIFVDGGDGHAFTGCTTRFALAGFFINRPAGFGPTTVTATGCYAEQHGVGFYFNGAVACTLSGCGVEAAINFDPTWNGKSYWITGNSRDITFLSCLARNDTIGNPITAPFVVIDGSSNNILIENFDRTLHATFTAPTYEMDYTAAGPNVTLGYNNFTPGTVIPAPILQEGLAATGNSSGTAAAITSKFVEVTSSTPGVNDGVRLPTLTLGKQYTIFNKTANPINVYPPSGQQINYAGADIPYALPAYNTITFYSIKSNSYYT